MVGQGLWAQIEEAGYTMYTGRITYEDFQQTLRDMTMPTSNLPIIYGTAGEMPEGNLEEIFRNPIPAPTIQEGIFLGNVE